MKKKITPQYQHKEKKYNVFGPDGHEYDIVVSGYDYTSIFSLYASSNYIWSENVRNTLILSLTDNGNRTEFNKNFKTIEYDELQYMRMLINFKCFYEKNRDGLGNTFSVVEQTILTEI